MNLDSASDRTRARVWAWLTVVALLGIYVARLSAAGPWDPWETHYGEVARNILVRNDPMDLWWQPGYGPDARYETRFDSKHALPFWCMALGMWLFGVGTGKSPGEMVESPVAEWAIRAPSLVVASFSAALLAWAVYRYHGWRAALLVVAVLASLPQFALVSRQALTDIYFVGPMCIALAAYALALRERSVRLRMRSWKASGRHIPWDRHYAMFWAFALVGIVLPLAVLHLHVIHPATVAKVGRWAKSPTIPSIEDLRTISIHFHGYWLIAALCGAASLCFRTRAHVWWAMYCIATGLAFMGKGLIGPALIIVITVAHFAICGFGKRDPQVAIAAMAGRASEESGQRRSRDWSWVWIASWSLGLFVLASAPWHHAMAVFRGERWVNALLIVNNLERFTSGEQPQAVGDWTFYLRTAMAAAFPWFCVLPQALSWTRRRLGQDIDDLALLRLALVWLALAFSVVTVSATKYHHYLVPCLPALALVIGIWLAHLCDPKDASSTATSAPSRWSRAALALLSLGMLEAAIRTLVNEPATLAHLTTYLYTDMWREGAPETDKLYYLIAPFVFGIVAWSWMRASIARTAMVLSGLLCVSFLLNDYVPAASENWSQRSALRVYFAKRAPRDELLSWWFLHRGETFLTKGRVWVLVQPDRAKLREYIEKRQGRGAAFWVITTPAHAPRFRAQLPYALRERVSIEYENLHHVLMRVPLD